MNEPETSPSTDGVEEVNIEGTVDLPTQMKRDRARTAKEIAMVLVKGFLGVLMVVLVGGLLMTIFAEPTQIELFMKLLRESAGFLSTIFGPILGFILGHYFGQRKEE